MLINTEGVKIPGSDDLYELDPYYLKNHDKELIRRRQEQIKLLCSKLRQDNPDLLGSFEDVLQKVSVDIRSATNSRGELEQILKSPSDIHEQEVSKLYEMEQQILGEKERLIAQEKERERREREEMDNEMRRKEELLNELLQKQAELEAKLTDLSITEKQAKEEKEILEQTNSQLFGKLQFAEKDLEQTKSYLKTLQDKVKEEKRARADASLRVTRGIAEERASLCKQLNLLREMNKKLLDERDAYTLKGEELNGNTVDRNPVVKQGSIMSDYFDPGDDHPNGHADINANSMPEDDEDIEYDYEYEYSSGTLPTHNNHQNDEYVLNDNHHSTYSSSSRLLPRDNSVDQPDLGFMAVRSSSLTHVNSTPLSEELAQSLHSEFEEITATEVDNHFSSPPPKLRQGGGARHHWSTSTHRADFNSSTETASIEDAPRGPGEGEESPLEEVNLSSKPRKAKSHGSDKITEEGSQETNLLKDPQRLYKVVFVGDSYVGKTSLMHRVCNDAFHDGFNATIGVDFQVKTMSVKGNSVAIQLWDTAGQERFRSITRHYFRKADAVIVVYDVTSEKSFLSLRNWMTSIEEVTDEHVVRVIIGNKVDLENLRQVQQKKGQEIAADYQSLFYEASAKSGINVTDCIEELAHKLLEKEDREMEEALKLINEVVAKKRCCRS